MKAIMVTGGAYAVVDDADYPKLVTRRWHLASGYALTSGEAMHTYILGYTEGTKIIHLNGNKLDNRRCNLKVVEVKRKDIHAILNEPSKADLARMVPQPVITMKMKQDAGREYKKATPRRPKAHFIPIVDEYGLSYPSAAAAVRSIGVATHNSSNIIRAVVRGRKAYGMRWFIDGEKITNDDLKKFCDSHDVLPEYVLY